MEETSVVTKKFLPLAVGQIIRIKKIPFVVLGIFKSKGDKA